MLRLCRNTLSFQPVDQRHVAGAPVIVFGDRVAESSPAAVPVGACFGDTQLNEETRLQLQRLLGEIVVWLAAVSSSPVRCDVSS